MIRAQSVSYHLAKGDQGFTRSRSLATRIRGWHKVTAGFEATQWAYDVVKVEYVHGDWATYKSDAERRRKRDGQLQAYKDRLEKTGFEVEWDREHHFLMVERGHRS